MEPLQTQIKDLSIADYGTFKLGDWKLQCGATLPDAHIAYRTFGDPKSPAIVYPTWFSGAISDNIWLIGEDKALNPKKFFIIITALFGNGQSTSPSNTSYPHPFPKVAFYDNVRAQHELVTQHLRITHLYCVIGWSMGAGQTYQWITQYPDMVDIAVPFCGSARTSLHNQVFLEGVKSALLAAKGIPSRGSKEGGVKGEGMDEKRVWSQEEKEVGLKAFGRVYAGWGLSQTFYREKLHEKHYGFKDLEAFMQGFWEAWACSKGIHPLLFPILSDLPSQSPTDIFYPPYIDPENLLAMLQTWQSGDCSNQSPYNGNFEKAMSSIKAKTLVLPAKTDLYFPPEDSEYEVANMQPGIGQLEVFPSIWGHWAGGPGDSKEDVEWLDGHLRRWFERYGK